MRALRWTIAGSLATIAFIITWWAVHRYGGLDHEPAAAAAAFVAGILGAPFVWWAGRSESFGTPRGIEAARQIEPSDNQRPSSNQIIVGDIPGEAAAWQARVDTQDRLRVMAGSGQTAVVTAVTGQRGIGKTQLVAAYARSRAAERWPVIIWIQAETANGVLAGLDALAAAVGLRQVDTDPADAAAVALRWLRSHPGPSLLVYDNAVNPDLIRNWTPSVGAVQTVVTTTDKGFENLGVRIEVEVFADAEAVTYLRERTGLNDDIGAAQLAEHLGRLPLALSHAGAVIGMNRRYRSYGLYLAHLKQLPIADLLHRPAGDPYPRGTAEAILLSLDDLANVDKDGHARRLLDHLAVLAPGGVDALLLSRINLQPPHQRRWWARLRRRASIDAVAVRAVLAQRSLITPTVESDRTVVHRLVQRVTRERADRVGDLDTLIVSAADAVAEAARSVGHRWEDRDLLAEYADHARTLWSHGGGVEPVQRELLALRAMVMEMLNEAHSFTTSMAIGPELLVDHERILGSEDPATLRVQNNLAYTFLSVGRFDDALVLHERTLTARERVRGPDHPETLSSRRNVAYAYMRIGRPDRAVELYERTLSGHEHVLGPDHLDTLIARNNLAGAYEAADRLEDAVELYTRTLADAERVLGPDEPFTLTMRNNVAHGYGMVGRVPEAIELTRSVIADAERIFGPDHPNTLLVRHNLASLYQREERLDEAIEIYDQNLREYERVVGVDYPTSMTARHGLAVSYYAAGRQDEAIALLAYNFAARKRVLGPDHPDTVLSRSSLVAAYQHAGRFDDADNVDRDR